LEQASPELSDEAFAEAAESLFLDLDAREADDAIADCLACEHFCDLAFDFHCLFLSLIRPDRRA
jgi:hypothetical protein